MSHSVIVVENGPQSAKEPLLTRMLARKDFDLSMLVNSGAGGGVNTWHTKYFSNERCISADLKCECETRSNIDLALRDCRLPKLDGIVTYLEECVPITDRIAKSFQLPRITRADDPRILRNKFMMRSALDGKLLQPRYYLCDTYNDMLKAIEVLGLPAIIKPVEMGSSLGVRKLVACDENQFASYFAEAQTVDFPGEDLKFQYGLPNQVLIEEFIPAAREISVEGLVANGQLEFMTVTHKHLTPEPFFDEIGHTNPIPEGLIPYGEIQEAIYKIIEGLKLEHTAIHAEFRIRPEDNRPVFVEVGARLGGDLIPILVENASGCNLAAATLDLAVGTRPFLNKLEQPKASSIVFLTTPKSRELAKQMSPELSRDPRLELWIDDSSTEHRFGHIILTENSYAAALELHDHLMRSMELK